MSFVGEMQDYYRHSHSNNSFFDFLYNMPEPPPLVATRTRWKRCEYHDHISEVTYKSITVEARFADKRLVTHANVSLIEWRHDQEFREAVFECLENEIIYKARELGYELTRSSQSHETVRHYIAPVKARADMGCWKTDGF